MPDDSLSANNYGLVSRLLHRLVLGNAFVGEALFDIEQSGARRAGRPAGGRPVFIVGLARSGTTALLEKIYATGDFRSLTYADMPFVLAPSIGRKLAGSKGGKTGKAERAHGDGILVDARSPEAFEEVFWRTFCGGSYIHEDRLTPHTADPETLQKFRLFVDSVVRTADDPRQTRYLSKNNNNLLRLPTIREAFPDAAIIVPFRDPVQQAGSLMNQHRLFCERHERDAFSLKYMNWLAHHEFGLGHKPFRFDGDQRDPYSPREFNYWLAMWQRSYQYLLASADEDTYFLCFERLCEHTPAELTRLSGWAGIAFGENDAQSAFALPPARSAEQGDPDLLSSCAQAYRDMVSKDCPG